jgi:hypothetical protein
MSIRTGTWIRILATLLLLAATSLGGTTVPGVAKGATGCSFTPDSSPTSTTCLSGGDGCYDCLYTTRYGWYECWENGDGSFIAGCSPWSPENENP